MTRSAAAARARTRELSRSDATDRLEVLRNRNSAPSPSGREPEADQARIGSPEPGGSTFTTSAPASANSFPQYGPAICVDSSRTRTPASGPRADGPDTSADAPPDGSAAAADAACGTW